MAMDFNNSNRKWKKGVMALCIALALSACDNKKEESASALLTETAQDSSATGKVEQKAKKARNEPVQDPEEVLSAKMQVYIECYNSLDESINRSIVRYASWINDLGMIVVLAFEHYF
ncbi:DUF3829 domain-containing protein [Xenorhabdus littoralis]|uniref:DUF3829 domain-containing protein n=1 Tax=Xenorhabdus littoralis TaxID=2582835 RepID=UPI0029E7D890|nr:DUF3829 domain-containing protein [Xenorhabdus sp. psl]MDX7989881.1 DUF3829 domain-containing protein [Xenorhabdus sp. psl]